MKTMAAILAAHQLDCVMYIGTGQEYLCICGVRSSDHDAHQAEELAGAGFGDVREASNRVGKRYAELHRMLRDELQAAALEEAAAWLDNGEMAEVIAYEGPSNRGEVIAAYTEAIEDPQSWLRARAAELRREA